MKLSSGLVRLWIALLGALTLVAPELKGQAQLEWIVERYYNPVVPAAVVKTQVDEQGGLFIFGGTQDTICYYSVAELVHISNSGTVNWINSYYYDIPCYSQGANDMQGQAGITTLSVTDTCAHLIRVDSSSTQVWSIDTTGYFPRIAFDTRQHCIAAHHYSGGANILAFDEIGDLQWSYTPIYPFTFEFKSVLINEDHSSVCIFSYDDISQAETPGIGVLKLDSNGVFLWDTLINFSSAPDPDVFVDASLDVVGNVFLLTRDNSYAGAFLSRIDASGNAVTTNVLTPGPTFIPRGLELDTSHNLLYIYGRTSTDLLIEKFDFAFTPLDTMLFDVAIPGGQHTVGVNSYGYMFHLWVCDTGSNDQLRLDMFNHGGQLVDSYIYWDASRFDQLFPHSVLFDRLGGIFLTCDAERVDNREAVLAIKLTNPLGYSDNVEASSKMLVFPNPANDNVSIQCTGEKVIKVKVTSMTGAIQDEKMATGETMNISTSQYPNGVYLIEAYTEAGYIHTDKLIIQR
jgi:hypothetical protein